MFIFRDVEAFVAIAGLPAVFLLGWLACWVFLRRAPLWGFALASAMSAASVILAWAGSSGGTTPDAAGQQRAVAFYGLFFNGITGLLWMGVLAIATAIIELVRMSVHRGTPEQASLTQTPTAARQG